MTILSKEEKWIGIDNHYLILEADDFIVFLDSDLDVDWLTSDKYDGTGPRDPVMQNEILNYAASLECIPNSHHKRNVRLNFKRMVGEELLGPWTTITKVLRTSSVPLATI